MPEVMDADALQAALTAVRALGAAEGQAMRAEAAANGRVDREVLIAEALGAAGCENELEALGVLRWQAGRLGDALQYLDLGGPYGARDRMMGTIVATAAALAGMVNSAYVMRDPESQAPDQKEAAAAWWAATDSLRQAFGSDEVRLAPDPGGDEGHEHGPMGCPSCDCR